MLYNLLIVFILPGSFSQATPNDLNYNDVTSWGGLCQTGQSQSPISINTKNMIYCPNIHTDFKFLSFANSF
jgi:carbonic anhydrase